MFHGNRYNPSKTPRGRGAPRAGERRRPAARSLRLELIQSAAQATAYTVSHVAHAYPKHYHPVILMGGKLWNLRQMRL